MKVAIIGAGNVGRSLGSSWRKAGHEIRYGLRNPSDSRYAALAPALLVSPAAAARDSEIVVLATPWQETENAVHSLGNLAGKIVVDCTNPLGMGADGLGLVLGHGTSAGELVAQWAKPASVFKAFNTSGASNLGDPSGYPVKPAMFVAGDDGAKKYSVLVLAQDLGFDAIDAGPLRIARLLEPMAMLWIDQALSRGAGQDFAFAVVRK
jgi:predicted dinucleotide-binding enzyme